MKQSSNRLFDTKMCANCGKDFDEKANFNWSCRTHKSTFGGEIWWCCGRKGKDDPGCRFGKHERKDENAEVGGGNHTFNPSQEGATASGIFSKILEKNKEDSLKCQVN